jgi:hypothetical protein
MKPEMEVDSIGTREWYLGYKLHREDGPAVEYTNGDCEWWVNGKIHRVDGPAIEKANGTREWYLDGKRHRIDGPAIERGNTRIWYLNGSIQRVESGESPIEREDFEYPYCAERVEKELVLETFEDASRAALCAQQSAHRANLSLDKKEVWQAYMDAIESASKTEKALSMAMSIIFPLPDSLKEK